MLDWLKRDPHAPPVVQVGDRVLPTARPMPRPEPVTIATLPCSFPAIAVCLTVPPSRRPPP